MKGMWKADLRCSSGELTMSLLSLSILSVDRVTKGFNTELSFLRPSGPEPPEVCDRDSSSREEREDGGGNSGVGRSLRTR
jgi:hypothetical protein